MANKTDRQAALNDLMETYGVMEDSEYVERKSEIIEALYHMRYLGREGAKWRFLIDKWRVEMGRAEGSHDIRWTLLQYAVYANFVV